MALQCRSDKPSRFIPGEFFQVIACFFLATGLALSPLLAAESGPTAGCFPVNEATSNLAGATKITFLYFNDFHGALEEDEKAGYGIARMVKAANDIRNENKKDGIPTYLVTSGDFLQGSLLSNEFKGEIEAACFNNMMLSYYNIGKHEIDFGLNNLWDLQKKITAPCVTANFEINDKPIGKPKIIQLNGLSVGLAGLVKSAHFNSAGLKIDPRHLRYVKVTDEFDAAKKVVDKFQAEGVDLIIFLTYLGIENDKLLARKVPGINIIFGGDSKDSTQTCTKEGDTHIVRTDPKGRSLGRVDLALRERKLEAIRARLIPLDKTVKPDPQCAHLIELKKRPLEKMLTEKIADNDYFLDGEEKSIRNNETNLGDLICDALKGSCQADAAVFNSGGIRKSIKAGGVSIGHIYETIPYLSNTAVILDMSGSQICDALNLSATKIKTGGFLQVAGLKFTLIPNKGVRDIQVNGRPLDPAKMYKVVTSSFLVEGGDGYLLLKDIKEDHRRYDYRKLTANIIEYIKDFYGSKGRHIDYRNSQARIIPAK
ncbi:MAG: 5'-nucleotidase C-terminal domain-containing protein [Deltaproteobacteria bacterium]|nr:5'-nucleotidase C-terminal domain-containing protein [Deltaproteobacteria bacterium]